MAVAFAHSQIKPAARQKVQGRNLLRKQHRVVPWQHKNRRAEAKARRSSRDKGQEGESGRHLSDASKVMLGHEARMEAECFGLDVGCDEIEEALRARRHVGQPAALRRRRTIQIAWEDLSEGFGLTSAATDGSYDLHRTRRREHGTVTLALSRPALQDGGLGHRTLPSLA